MTTPSERPVTHWHVFREWREPDGTLRSDGASMGSERQARFVAGEIFSKKIERRGVLGCRAPILGSWEKNAPVIFSASCRAMNDAKDGPMPDEAEIMANPDA